MDRPVFPQTIKNYTQTVVNADGTTVKTVAIAGTNGSKIESLLVTSSDTSARDLVIYITISATNYPIGIVSIPITAGTVDTVPTVDILRSAQLPGLPFDACGNRYLYLASGSSLSVSAGTTVTTAKQLTIVGQGADF